MSIEEAISSNNFSLALSETKAAYTQKKLKEREALNILLSLAKILKNSNGGNIHCEDIFTLTNICCSVVEENCETCFFSSLYYIIKHLVLEGSGLLGRKLAVYLLKSKSLKSKLKEDHKIVLTNLYSIFEKFLFGIKPGKDLIVGENSFLSWWQFILELAEVNNYTHFPRNVFIVLIKSAMQSQESTNPKEFGCQMLNLLGKWLLKKGSLSESEICSICKIIKEYYTRNLEKTECITNFIRCLVENCHQSINLLNPVLLLMECFSDCGSRPLKSPELLSIVKSLNYSDFEFNSLLSCITIELSCKLNSSTIIEIETYLSYCIFLHLKLLQIYNNEKGESIIKYITYPLLALMKVISEYEEKSFEEKIFSRVYKCIELFFSNSYENSIPCFNYGVKLCALVIQAYMKKSVIGKAYCLAKLSVKNIFTMKWSHESLQIDFLLKTYIYVSCGNEVLEVEAMAHILGIAASNSTLKINVFKYWCLLKEKSTHGRLLNLTVYDIICSNGSLDETMPLDINEWPFNVIKHMDYEKYLLDEIVSYVKASNMKKQKPVIAVYKKALQVVKNKQILAKITCCTVDALTSEPDCQINLSKLKSTIKSLINKNEGQDSLLGDLYYMSARCELSAIRKAAQVENIDEKDNLPLFEDFSGNNSNSQLQKLLECLKLASEHWKKALLEDNAVNVDYGTLNYIKGVAYLYRLLKYTALEIQTWNILYDVSKKFNFEKHKILSVAELLESNLNVDKAKIIEVRGLSSSSQHKDTYYHSLFLVQLARNKLKNSEYEEAINILSEVDTDKIKYSAINQGRWYLIKFLVTNADDSQLHTDHPIESLLKSYKSLDKILRKTSGTFCENCVIQSLAFELCLVLAKSMYYMSDVTTVAMYCRQLSKSTSLLAFPLRRCEFLSEMAQLSAIKCDKTELFNKITNIESILEVNLIKNLSSNQEKVLKLQLTDQPERLPLLISLHSLWGRYYQLKDEKQQSIKIFTNGIGFANSLRKTMTQELVDSFLEHEMRLYLTAATCLICWGKYSKAKTYCDYVLLHHKKLKIKDKLFLQYARTIHLCSVVNQVDFIISTCEIPPVDSGVKDENTSCTPVNDNKSKPRVKQHGPHKMKLVDPECRLPITPKPYHRSLALPDDEVQKCDIPEITVTNIDGETLVIIPKLNKGQILPISTPNKINVFCDSSDLVTSPCLRKKKLTFTSPKVNIKSTVNLSNVCAIESPVDSVNITMRRKKDTRKKK